MKHTIRMPLLLTLCMLVSSCLTDDATPPTAEHLARQKLVQHARLLKQYAGNCNACSNYGILIDMSLPSWQKRFFVVNLQNDSVLVSGLCAHGRGSSYQQEEVVFSNTPNSYCTSEGRYKVEGKYYGQFGLAYKLHGLDATNSKAYERFVVFHSHNCVSDFEGEPTCRSDGCPTVSPAVLKQTSALLDNAGKPVLMWIYK